MLQGIIDGELRYGLAVEEEQQLLYGDGSGETLFGIVPQASPYAALWNVDKHNRADDLLLGIAQAQAAKYPATGIVVNDVDWLQMMSLKDDQGRYLGNGPWGANLGLCWSLPVVATPTMLPGAFLVGAFQMGAQLIDRMQATLTIVIATRISSFATFSLA
jgi:HK97 family phage major capsid protein